MTALRAFTVVYVIENKRTNRRNEITTTVFAETLAEVRQIVAKQFSGHVVKATEQKITSARRWFASTIGQQLQILRQLVNHLTLRASPSAALQLMVANQPSARRLALTPASEIVARGGTLAEGLRQLGFFKETILKLIEAGERTNTARDAINHAIALLDSQRRLLNQFYSAMGWIMIDIVATISSISYLHLTFLPDMKAQGISTNNPEIKADFEWALTVATYVNASLYYGLYILAFAGYGLFLLYTSKRTTDGGIVAKIENAPVLRTYLSDSGMAQAFSALGRILKTGMHLTEALAVAAQATTSRAVNRMLLKAKQRIEFGEPIGDAFNDPILNAAERLEIQNQPSTKTLAEACTRIGDAREEASKTSNRRLITTAVVASIVYGSLSALSFLWVLVIQNKAQMESLNSLGQ